MSFSDEVVAGVRAGNADAVGAVYVSLADRLLSYLIARVRDQGVAEDLLEATFVELLQRGNTINGGGPAIKSWLFRAAHFNALDHLRKQKRRAEDLREDTDSLEVIDPRPGPEESLITKDVRLRVRKAMEQLSDDQRQVLLLRYVAGLSAPEVAEILGKTDGAVRSLQHRGERSLARLLAEDSAVAPASVAGSQTSQT